ncbi:Protein CBG02321, partial [Caenorhabditis briggsae]
FAGHRGKLLGSDDASQDIRNAERRSWADLRRVSSFSRCFGGNEALANCATISGRLTVSGF